MWCTYSVQCTYTDTYLPTVVGCTEMLLREGGEGCSRRARASERECCLLVFIGIIPTRGEKRRERREMMVPTPLLYGICLQHPAHDAMPGVEMSGSAQQDGANLRKEKCQL